MKRVLLKNKNTGTIGELSVSNRIVVYEPDMPLCGNSILGEYDTLAELNKYWEDYKIVEPLIKDEKIRKAVKAWAESNYYDKLLIYHDHTAISFYNEDDDNEITFNTIEKFGLEHLKCYTITELCGEEENE